MRTWIAALLFLSGCASSPTPTNEVPIEHPQVAAVDQTYVRIKQGFAANEQYRRMISALQKQKKITAAQAKNMRAMADLAKQGLELAAAAYLSGQDASAVEKAEAIHNDLEVTGQEAVNQGSNK